MLPKPLISAVGVCLLAALLVLPYGVESNGRVMPWMCLERCGDNSSQILEQIAQLASHKDVIAAVSFEYYNLGPNSNLVDNTNLSRVHKILQAMGFETYAMLSSYPYPSEFLSWMRQLWSNPEPFFHATLLAAQEQGFTGYNVDFEPNVTATPQDAQDYANFLNKFSQRLGTIGRKLTVDVATWNPLWNFQILSQTSVSRIMTMSTYTGNLTSWQNQFTKATQAFRPSQLGIGLQTIIFTDDQLKPRFDAIAQAGVQEIDIWKTPIPDSWWPYLTKFVKNA